MMFRPDHLYRNVEGSVIELHVENDNHNVKYVVDEHKKFVYKVLNKINKLIELLTLYTLLGHF